MDKLIDHIISLSDREEELSTDQVDQMRTLLASDPELHAAYRHWLRLQKTARQNLDDRIGDPHVFILSALHNGGHTDHLTSAERARAEDAADQFESAVNAARSLKLVAEDIADSADVFSEMWDAKVGAGAADDLSPERRIARAPRRRTPSSAARWGVRAALALSLAAFVFVLVQLVQRDSGMITVATAEGETRVVELTPGSQVRLLGSSRLSYVDPKSASLFIRQASLEGKGYFEIAREERGFIVKTPNARVTVLGTTFGVDANGHVTEVVLTDGRLTLSSADNLTAFVLLEPGQMSRVAADGSPIQPIEVNVSERLAWTGLFVFHSTPLGEITERLSGHFDVPITVDDSLAGEQVTGTFEQNQALGDILDVIGSAVGATVRAAPTDGYIITHP